MYLYSCYGCGDTTQHLLLDHIALSLLSVIPISFPTLPLCSYAAPQAPAALPPWAQLLLSPFRQGTGSSLASILAQLSQGSLKEVAQGPCHQQVCGRCVCVCFCVRVVLCRLFVWVVSLCVYDVVLSARLGYIVVYTCIMNVPCPCLKPLH